jgi:hypothetical protein
MENTWTAQLITKPTNSPRLALQQALIDTNNAITAAENNVTAKLAISASGDNIYIFVYIYICTYIKIYTYMYI